MATTTLKASLTIEVERVRSQIVTASGTKRGNSSQFAMSGKVRRYLRSQTVISNGKGGRRYTPCAFNEHGVAMLSGILRSQRAVEVKVINLVGMR